MRISDWSSDVCSSDLDLMKTTLGSGIAIETRFPLHLSAAHADPAQLELALLNLAMNARAAMPGGGRIIIEGAEAIVSQAQRTDLVGGHYVRLSVIDAGEGLAAEKIGSAPCRAWRGPNGYISGDDVTFKKKSDA